MKAKLFILIFTLSAFQLIAQDNANEILNRMADMLAAHTSVSYDVVYKEKFGFRDSNIIRAKVELLRVDTDSHIHGYMKWTAGDTEFQLYYNWQGWDVKKNTKTVIKGHYEPKYYSSNVVDEGPVWKEFLYPHRSPEYNNDFKLLEDTIISGITCWHIVEHPKDLEFVDENMKNHKFINKENYEMITEYSTLIQLGQYVYYYMSTNNVVFDNVGVEDFNPKQIPRNYKTKEYSTARLTDSTQKAMDKYWLTHIPNRTNKLLDTGTVAEQINGKNAWDGQEESIEFSGNITVLDFWFMGCPPCVEAIPKFDSMKKKYAGKGVQFYGVDCIDTTVNDFSRFQNFFKKHQVSYTTLIASNDLPNYYNISGYPVCFIIGKDGKVKYSGWLEDVNKLGPVIDGLLSEP